MDLEDIFIKAMSKLLGRNGEDKAIFISSESMSAFSKDFICGQQLNLSKFLFKSADLHKNFKQNPSKQTFEDLEDFIIKQTKENLVKIRMSIEEYFKIAHINKNKPVVSIGVFSEGTKGETLEILTHTDSQLSGDKRTRIIKEYHPLEFILEFGVPYKCNFIPKAIKSGNNYKYKGIEIERVKNSYKIRKFLDSKTISRRGSLKRKLPRDKSWEEICKQGLEVKSTLVVPITFKKWAELIDGEKLKQLLFPDTGERSIFGCITVEHQDTYFFDNKNPESNEECDNIDVNMLYIFADFVSLYQSIQRNYTICSDTWIEFNKKRK